MPEIFLSYTHEDGEAAGRIEKALRDLGIEVWIDNRLETGARFTDHIHKQIDAAGAVIVCWSKKATESPWVQAEALFALDRGKLTPVLIGKCELRPPFNAVNASNLIDWRGDARHAGWQRLLLALEKALDGVKLADRALVDELRISGADVATPEAARRRRMFRAAIIAGVAIPAVAAASIVGYTLWDTRTEIAAKFENDQEQRRREGETQAQRMVAQSAWDTARDLGTRAAIETFKRDNPESPFLREADQVLAEITAQENATLSAAERARRELAAWQAARSIEDYQNFKIAYPWSRRDADGQIARLQREAAEAADTGAWESAEAENTIVSYERYIRGADRREYPGVHRSRAEARIADLRVAANRQEDDRRWAAARGASRSGQVAAYDGYLVWARQHGGSFIQDATDARNLLQREDQLIGVADRERTAAAYRDYLREFPSGHYQHHAEVMRDRYSRDEERAAEDVAAFEDARRTNRRAELQAYVNRVNADYERRRRAYELIDALNRADDDAWSLAERERDPQRRRERILAYQRTYESDRYARHLNDAERELRRLDSQPTTTATTGGTQTGGSRPTTATPITPTQTPATTGGSPPSATTPTGSPSGDDGDAPARGPQEQDSEANPFGGRQRDPD